MNLLTRLVLHKSYSLFLFFFITIYATIIVKTHKYIYKSINIKVRFYNFA